LNYILRAWKRLCRLCAVVFGRHNIHVHLWWSCVSASIDPIYSTREGKHVYTPSVGD